MTMSAMHAKACSFLHMQMFSCTCRCFLYYGLLQPLILRDFPNFLQFSGILRASRIWTANSRMSTDGNPLMEQAPAAPAPATRSASAVDNTTTNSTAKRKRGPIIPKKGSSSKRRATSTSTSSQGVAQSLSQPAPTAAPAPAVVAAFPKEGHDTDLDDLTALSDSDLSQVHSNDDSSSSDDDPDPSPSASTANELAQPALAPLIAQMAKANKKLADTVKAQLAHFDKKTQRRLDEKIRLKGPRNTGEHKRLSAILKVSQDAPALHDGFVNKLRSFIEDYDTSENMDSALRRLLAKVRRMKWPKKFDTEGLIALLEVDTKPTKSHSKQRSNYSGFRQNQGSYNSAPIVQPNPEALQLAQLLTLQNQAKSDKPLCFHCRRPGHPPERCFLKFPALKQASTQP